MFGCFDWFGLVLRNFCRNGEVSKELLSIFFQKLCSCFGYRLSYNHPNGMIPSGKGP